MPTLTTKDLIEAIEASKMPIFNGYGGTDVINASKLLAKLREMEGKEV